ncbi:MAG: sugar transferase [Candidatus Margulisbacteria bacterium]|jgi:exopolysaccharide biosynthesis polyprenyl glycosylphosphotransferase|nr:sugar transferase [Candidatus Margulisiibacteriota bacterium]
MFFKSRLRRFFTCVKILLDTAVIAASFCLGYIFKFKMYWFGIGEITPHAVFTGYWQVLSYIIGLWLVAFAYSGMYRYFAGPTARMREIAAIIKGVILGVFEVMAFTFLITTFPDSRYVLVYAGLSAIVLLSICRTLLAWVMAALHKRGHGNKRALIIGATLTAQRIAEKIINYPEYGFNYCGFICDRKPAHLIHPLKNRFVRLGGLREWEKLLRLNRADAVFADGLSARQISALTEFCQRQGIYFRYHSELLSKNIFWEDLDAVNLIGVKVQKFSGINRFLKRAFDLLLTVPLLALAAPLMLCIYLGIKLTSPGPALYKQTRVTAGGRHFEFLKFRSMPVDSEKNGPVLSTGDQKHRATSFGYFLRKTSLDELPQLFNVLRGEMSIVGPRPERPVFHEQYLAKIPHWAERLAVPGGLTGWAQINGRAELSAIPLEKLEYDIYYIENWSLLFDIMILLRTLGYVLRQKDVY